ncbi:MAG: hypothetical protein JWM91_3133 [Rhodospirillales bacterium]|nr:hypothetical protein [Rhodospirillales bacterium]
MSDLNRSLAIPSGTRSAAIEPVSLEKHTARRPFPPMRLSRAARAALIGLRLFLGLITAMAIFTFLHGNRP